MILDGQRQREVLFRGKSKLLDTWIFGNLKITDFKLYQLVTKTVIYILFIHRHLGNIQVLMLAMGRKFSSMTLCIAELTHTLCVMI